MTTDAESRALQTIRVRGPYLLDISTIHEDWYEISNQPLDTDPDGEAEISPEIAEALIRDGKVVEVARGHAPNDPGTQIIAYKVA